MTKEAFLALPPQGPPPLLSEDQLLDLARQGWLEIALPESMTGAISALLRDSDSFFTHPPAIKKELFPQKQTTEFGYYEVKHEKEYVTFRCRTQQSNTITRDEKSSAMNLELSTARIWSEAGTILHRILCDIARASELDPKVWDAILDGTLEMPVSEELMSYTLMRVFRYLPTIGTADEHTDLGLLTMCIGDRHGLQVCDRINSLDSGLQWVNASEGADHAMILVGQTLKMLSNGSLNAGIHRVTGNPLGRNSIVYALRHSSRNPIDLALFGGDECIRPEELYKVMGVGKVNINAIKDTREKQREVLEGEGLG